MRFRCLIGISFLMTLKGSEGATQAECTTRISNSPWWGYNEQPLKTCFLNITVVDDENFAISSTVDRETLALNLVNKAAVEFLPTNMFLVFPDLVLIEAQSCSVKTVGQNHFRNLSKLDVLHLGGNKIEHVASDAFVDLVSLTSLYLSRNRIQSLDANTFSSLKALKTLYLNDNQIQHLDPKIFKPLVQVSAINVDANLIATLDGKIFESLKQLKLIDLSNNKLKGIPGTLFQNNLKLQQIKLDHNEIEFIDWNMFDRLPKLTLVGLGGNVCVDKSYGNYWGPGFENAMRADLKQNCSVACGAPKHSSGLIVRGQNFPHGAFPWIVALMLTKSRPHQFFCAGTLISETFVVSAAHCIQNKGGDSKFLARDILAIFGVHDLNNPYEAGRITRSPIKIFIHKDWNHLETSYDADISLLKFRNGKIIFSDYIQPICLWNSETEPAVTTGVVTGWGKSEDPTKLHENLPKMIPAPVLLNEKCWLDDKGLIDISSERTFCAGLRNGSGVCNGDSGGGLFINVDGLYHLKGIVSSSVFTYQGCDVSRNAVYTNVLKFKRWIRMKTQQAIEG